MLNFVVTFGLSNLRSGPGGCDPTAQPPHTAHTKELKRLIQIQECGFHPGCGTMEQLFTLACPCSLYVFVLICPLRTEVRTVSMLSTLQ